MPDDEAVLSDSDASSSDGGGGDDDDSASSDDGMGGRQEDERERSIRYNPNRSAKRIGGEFTAYDHRGKRTTHFHNALANGEFDRYRGGDPQGAGTIDARRILDNDAADVSSRGAGFAVNLYQFGCVEKAIKLLFPAEPEAAMIQKWIESATNLDVVCDFTPFSDEIIVSLLTFYTAKPTQTINGVSCYGLAYGQARAMLAGIIMAHRELGFAFTPTKVPAIAHLLKRIEANSDPKGAASFDPAEDLKPMIQGLMCHPGRPFLKRIQDCTMLVLHFYLMARVSDMTVFAFDASDIKWPKNNSRHFGLDGQPLFCDVTLKQSKGKRKKADSHKRARPLPCCEYTPTCSHCLGAQRVAPSPRAASPRAGFATAPRAV